MEICLIIVVLVFCEFTVPFIYAVSFFSMTK